MLFYDTIIKADSGLSSQEGKLNISLQERINDLKVRHQNLEKMLDDETDRMQRDDVHISDLKKQKLAIKDQIENLKVHSQVFMLDDRLWFKNDHLQINLTLKLRKTNYDFDHYTGSG